MSAVGPELPQKINPRLPEQAETHKPATMPN
jgi:hypothetical protein